jgi:hypothetical protein
MLVSFARKSRVSCRFLQGLKTVLDHGNSPILRHSVSYEDHLKIKPFPLT